MRTKGIPKITAEMRRELKALDKLSDDDIDFSDIPEWDGADPVYVGLMYRPGKKSVTIRLDEDMVRWFKKQGKGWQTKMNWVLRLYFASHRKTGVKVGRP
ncbi:MAG TPA: BrnA antitoxin family protein [Rhizomicrobium sp.]|nr:BrnA antitoxin family protein [Rhizomicrobium sp.]